MRHLQTTFNSLVCGTILFLCVVGCASMKESVKARKMLEKCGYALTEVQLDLIDFESTITFDNSSKKFNLENPDEDIFGLIKEIKNGEFSVDLSKLRFNAVIEITNPNDVDVELDSLKMKAYLDDAFLVDIRHLEHTIISPKSTIKTNVGIQLPTTFPVKQLFTAEDIVLKGKIWLNLNLNKKTSVTLPVPVSFRKEIPREEINAAIQKEKDEQIKALIDYITSKGVKNKLKKALKGF